MLRSHREIGFLEVARRWFVWPGHFKFLEKVKRLPRGWGKSIGSLFNMTRVEQDEHSVSVQQMHDMEMKKCWSVGQIVTNTSLSKEITAVL